MVRSLRLLLIIAFYSLIMQSCLNNDFPYPTVRMYVTSVNIEGQIGDAIISNDNMMISVSLMDTVNLKKVRINSIGVTEGGRLSFNPDTIVDLTESFTFSVSYYQDYSWTLTATQEMNRIFTVEGQIGTTRFYPETYEASVNIPEGQGLDNIRITDLKLGPTGSSVNGSMLAPEFTWKVINDKYAYTTAKVKYKDFFDEEWKLYVYLSDQTVTTKSVDAWTKVAWLHGEGQEGMDNGFEYKTADSEEWIKVPSEYISHDKGSFTARLIHLTPNTEYVCRAYSGTDYGTELSFTTGSEFQPENPGFEYTSGTSPFYLFGEGQDMWWDTGNTGSATMNKNVTTVDTQLKNSGKQSLLLSSQFVGLGIIGKFAAGNVFVGKYLKTDGTDGILGWGRPCTDRPTALKLWVRYTPGIVDNESAGKISNGDTDKGNIYIAIGDWKGMTEGSETWPFIVKTKNASSLFSKDKGTYSGDGIIAYGEYVFEEIFESENGGLKELTIPLNYEDYGGYDRVPSSIIIVASASYYGDFFAGSTKSKMWIDDVSLEYDYEE